MTIDDLADKMDERFNRLDGKVDNVRETVAVHSQAIATHDRENKDFRERIARLEKMVWASLGAGAAAGAGVAKMFL